MTQTLSSTEVDALAADGDHYVDRNLRLQIRNGGKTRSWVFRYQINGQPARARPRLGSSVWLPVW